MRIAGTSYSEAMADQINLISARQYQLQNEATTGQSIQSPSDNPAGMEEALGLQTQLSSLNQYAQNISTLQTQGNQVATALQQLKTISDQAGEIATGIGSLTSTTQMQGDAAQITQLIKQAVAVVNSKSGNEYLFDGVASGQAPFTLNTDANGNVTSVVYSGNASVTQTQIGDNSALGVTIPGQNNGGAGPRGLVSDNRYGADLFNHLISLQNDLLSGNGTAISTVDQPALQKDSDNIIYQIGSNGATLTQLQAAASAVSSQQTSIQSSLNNVAGADLTQTLVQLSQAQNSYQIALQSSSQIMQLQQSLLMFLP